MKDRVHFRGWRMHLIVLLMSLGYCACDAVEDAPLSELSTDTDSATDEETDTLTQNESDSSGVDSTDTPGQGTDDTDAAPPCYFRDTRYEIGESVTVMSCDTCDEICKCTYTYMEGVRPNLDDCTDCHCGETCDFNGVHYLKGDKWPADQGMCYCGFNPFGIEVDTDEPLQMYCTAE